MKVSAYRVRQRARLSNPTLIIETPLSRKLIEIERIYVTVNVYTQEICIIPEKNLITCIFPDSLRNFVYLLKMSGNIHIS